MGTWGTSIEDNDTYNDIQREFFDLYNQGISLDKIYSEFISDEDFEDIPEESHDFWFAIADLLWQCKGLNDEVFKVVKNIIESKSDLDYWKETNGDHDDIKERENELNQFLEKISISKSRAKKRIKKKLYESLFEKGDVLTFKLDNNNYGIALIISDENGAKTESGKNLIVLFDFESIKKPTLNEIKKVNVQYILSRSNNKKLIPVVGDVSNMSWQLFSNKTIKIEIITNINVRTLNFNYLEMYLNWEDLPYYSRKNSKKIEVKNRLVFKDFMVNDSVV